MDRLRALPGVAVGRPRRERAAQRRHGQRALPSRGLTGERGPGLLLQVTFAAGDYFKTMGIDVLGGPAVRDERPPLGAPQRRRQPSRRRTCCGPERTRSGKRLQRQGLDRWETVIGVVDDVMQDNFRERPTPLVYFPLVGPEPMALGHLVAGLRHQDAARRDDRADVRAIVHEMAPEAPMYRVFTMAGLARRLDGGRVVHDADARRRVRRSRSFSAPSVSTACCRTSSPSGRARSACAWRSARGPDRSGGWWSRRGRASWPLACVDRHRGGVVATRALGSLLFGVAAIDAATFVGMSGSMIAIGLLASYLPARRASKVDPIVSLRGD